MNLHIGGPDMENNRIFATAWPLLWPRIRTMVEAWEADRAKQIWKVQKLVQYSIENFYYPI